MAPYKGISECIFVIFPSLGQNKLATLCTFSIIPVLSVSLSGVLTVITILKHESKRIDLRIQEAKDLENKLKYDLSFLKVEWDYLTSPKNISKLSKTHLDYHQASLISLDDFLKILEKVGNKK